MPASALPTTASLPAPESPARWMALVCAVERLASAETLTEIIHIVRTTARSVSGADGVGFILKDKDKCHYVEEDAVGPLWKGRRFPLTACISGWCMLNDENAVIPDIYVDERIPHDAYRPTFVKSLVMVPVKTSEPIAAIGSYWAEERSFDDGEVALLQALARSTAAAIAAVQMRQSLRESEAWLGMALTAGRLGVWDLDFPSDTLTASKMCKVIFGRAVDAPFTAADMRQAIHPDDRQDQIIQFHHNCAEARDLYTEYRIVWPDGSQHWIAQRGRAIVDADGNPMRLSCVVGDITEHREARERMDRLQSDIAHIGRLTEMGQMVSAFAHELRQPLTAANNYLSAAKRILARDDAPPARATELIGKADEQFVRATEIIERIRSFAGRTDSEKSPQNVRATIAEASELAKLDPRHRGVDVRVRVTAGLKPALIDKVQIQQVLLNLLRNAFEATEDYATRTVIVDAKPDDDLRAIEISVRDSGPGLAPEVIARLFQPFVTTKENGMGVGLSICRTIVESHGGRMWADCEPGHGAAFHFTVPAAA